MAGLVLGVFVMDKSTHRIGFAFLITLCTALVLAVCALAPQQAYADEPNYNLYKKVLKDTTSGIQPAVGVKYYSIFDIDADGTAELLYCYVSAGDLSQMTVYTIKESRTVKIYDAPITAYDLVLYRKGSTLYYASLDSDLDSSSGEAGRITKNGTTMNLKATYSGDNPVGYLNSLGAKQLDRTNTSKEFLLPGWKKDDKGWWYRRADGTYPYNKWEKIKGKWYHFDKIGYMQTGWLKTGTKWYFLDKKTGAMQTGWKIIGEKWYFFDKTSGVMAWNEWREGYWLNKDGTWTYKYKGSWHKNKKGQWFGDTSGWYAKNGYQWIDGKKYYFNSSGYKIEKKVLNA